MKSRFYLMGLHDGDRTETFDPTAEQLFAAIEVLDGRRSSGFVLRPDGCNKPYLAIGGGSDGRYVVYIAVDGVWAKHVVNPKVSRGEDDCRIMCGGQKTDLDMHFV